MQESSSPGRLAIAAANTVYAVRGQVRDGVDTPSGWQDWLEHHVGPLGARRPSSTDLDTFRRMRDAVRSLLNSTAVGEPPDPAAVLAVNESAALAPAYRALSVLDGSYTVAQCSTATPTMRAIAVIAEDAIGLLASERGAQVHLCAAPRCVQFFLDDHHGRRWCSPACGNRARAARHYRRHAANRRER
jgi:predicted RNA-binding Zn ribbon-like protein